MTYGDAGSPAKHDGIPPYCTSLMHVRLPTGLPQITHVKHVQTILVYIIAFDPCGVNPNAPLLSEFDMVSRRSAQQSPPMSARGLLRTQGLPCWIRAFDTSVVPHSFNFTLSVV